MTKEKRDDVAARALRAIYLGELRNLDGRTLRGALESDAAGAGLLDEGSVIALRNERDRRTLKAAMNA